MKVEEIEYVTRDGSATAELGLFLPGGYWVQKTHFHLANALITAGLDVADLRKPKTAKDICNDPTWNSRSCGVRIKLGRCIKYFVVNEMLNLRIANEGKKGSRKYTHK